MAKLSQKPEDRDHLKLKVREFEATAIGRFPIACVFVLALFAMIGRAQGWW